MKILKNKKVILTSLVLFILLALFLVVIFGKSQDTAEQDPTDTQSQDTNPSFETDLDGDGIKEMVKIITLDNGQMILEAYNAQGDKIATIPQERPIPALFSHKDIKLDLICETTG